MDRVSVALAILIFVFTSLGIPAVARAGSTPPSLFNSTTEGTD